MKRKSLFLLALVGGMLVSCGKTPASSLSSESSAPISTEASSSAPVSSETSSSVVPDAIVSIQGEAEMLYGRNQTVTASIQNRTAQEVVWSVEKSSDDQDILKVTAEGVVTGVGIGTANVVATSVEDTEAVAKLAITVGIPQLTEEQINVEGNYTLNLSYNTKAGAQTYVNLVNEKGMTDGGKNNFWYADGKVFPVHALEDKTTCYYTDEYYKNSKGEAVNATSFSTLYNIKTLLSNSDWSYAGYDSKTEIDFYDSKKAEGASMDYALLCFTNYFILSSYTTAFVKMAVTKDGIAKLYFVTGTTEDDGVLMAAAYTDIGTTELGFTPVEKKFHEGGEAGDGDGSGEDF
ncbi:MAG: hypothetical protein WCS80_01790 [Bacilli bacterium]